MSQNKLDLELDLSGISESDLTLLREDGSRGMPEFAASCCSTGFIDVIEEVQDQSCSRCDDACDDGGSLQFSDDASVSASELTLF